MKTTLNILVPAVKWLSVIAGLATLADALPPKYGAWAVAAFGVVSAIKDSLVKVGDLLDDGTANQSFKP